MKTSYRLYIYKDDNDTREGCGIFNVEFADKTPTREQLSATVNFFANIIAQSVKEPETKKNEG